MIDIQAKAQQVYDEGFCVLPGVYSDAEVEESHRLLNEHWAQVGSPKLEGFGMGIHPLAEKVPEMMPLFGKQIVVDVMALVLRDEVHLVHTGARVSNEDSAAAIGWHNHYSWDDENWIPASIPGRAKIERILAGVYPQGSNAESGNLVVLPRKFNDPLTQPSEDMTADWDGQILVEAPRGSAVIFDTALWHTARRGTQPGMRHLFGAHYQGWSDARPHVEDNPCDGPQVQVYKQENAALRGLLDGPA